jgi:hypothetical protein
MLNGENDLIQSGVSQASAVVDSHKAAAAKATKAAAGGAGAPADTEGKEGKEGKEGLTEGHEGKLESKAAKTLRGSISAIAQSVSLRNALGSGVMSGGAGADGDRSLLLVNEATEEDYLHASETGHSISTFNASNHGHKCAGVDFEEDEI